MSARSKLLLYLSILLFLSVLALKLVYALPAIFDLSRADEAGYLYNARMTLRADGFLYLLWLRLLQYFADPVSAFYVNFAVLVVSFAVVAFVWLRSVSRSFALALLLAPFFAFSFMNVLGWPYIVIFPPFPGQETVFSVRKMCRVLDVSESGFYETSFAAFNGGCSNRGSNQSDR